MLVGKSFIPSGSHFFNAAIEVEDLSWVSSEVYFIYVLMLCGPGSPVLQEDPEEKMH